MNKEIKEKIVNYCERHNLLSEDIDYFVDLFEKALQAQNQDLLKKIEEMIPEWLKSSIAHSDRDKLAVECFMEYLERELFISIRRY